MKRVLIIASWYDPKTNVGSFFRGQAEILAREFKVTMCFPGGDNNLFDCDSFKLFSYKKINKKLGSSKFDALRGKYQLRRTAEVIMRNGPYDICIAQNIISAGFIAYELKKTYQIPYVTIHHNPYMPGLNYFNNNWRVGRIMKNSLENFVVSNDLLRNFRIAGRSEKIKVIHNPVNVNFEMPTTKDNTAKYITIAISGQFNIKFNHELFFKALNYLKDETLKKLKIVWLGYNSWGGNLTEEDVSMGIKKALPNFELNIELFSSLQKQEMMYYLASSDLYVHTSFTETFGITSLEAMKLGVPVLSTQNGGINEYVIQNVNGVVINSFEPKIFANGLQNILDNLNKFESKIIKRSVENIATEKEYLRVLIETIGDSSN